MSCGSKTMVYVATALSDDDLAETFVPVSPPLSLRDFSALRGQIEVMTDNANVESRLGYRYSDDGQYWVSSASGVGTAVTGAGWFYGSWLTPPASSAGFIQLGVMVKNISTVKALESTTVRLIVEQRS